MRAKFEFVPDLQSFEVTSYLFLGATQQSWGQMRDMEGAGLLRGLHDVSVWLVVVSRTENYLNLLVLRRTV